MTNPGSNPTHLLQEIQKRKTFGIISHPDAGKTTLTEKLLLFGGAINTAGTVKARKAAQYATSDFMEIEKQRGISVSSSVMGFEYKGKKINIVDTPGHEDFCEDTYRTLSAVDSAIMVIDSVKGVEKQTYKLLDVCKMHHSPIMTFLNKLDREGRDPIELLDEIESRLGITVCPMSWPIGSGKSFKGVYSLFSKTLVLFKPHSKQESSDAIVIRDLNDSKLSQTIGELAAKKLRDDIELVTGIYPSFEPKDYLEGTVTPVFFGSALNNFGVKELLDCFIEYAPSPTSRQTDTRCVKASEEKFSGFIFKIHANIDPKHRDRIAFLRICSGIFERNKRYINTKTKKEIKAANPTAFMAAEKSIIDHAYPGDIVGLHDTGNLKIGDTLTTGEIMVFKGIPNFSPEIFKICINEDPLKTKQLEKGLLHLTEEGVAQLFTKLNDPRKIIGTVGALQFEVIQYRLEHEYGAKCRFEPLNYIKACWITSDDTATLNTFIQSRKSQIGIDKTGKTVYFAETQWSLDREKKEHPRIVFSQSTDEN